MLQVPSLLLKGNMTQTLVEVEQLQGEMLQAELYTVTKVEQPLI